MTTVWSYEELESKLDEFVAESAERCARAKGKSCSAIQAMQQALHNAIAGIRPQAATAVTDEEVAAITSTPVVRTDEELRGLFGQAVKEAVGRLWRWHPERRENGCDASVELGKLVEQGFGGDQPNVLVGQDHAELIRANGADELAFVNALLDAAQASPPWFDGDVVELLGRERDSRDD